MLKNHLLIHGYGAVTATMLPSLLRVARNAADQLGTATDIHIVVQGPAVALLTKGSEFTVQLNAALVIENMEIVACQNSMTSAGVAAVDLLPSITVVPAAVAYLAEKQWDGWAYVRI